jgi:MFS family permease
MKQASSWTDLLADGLGPRFGFLCLGAWLNAADNMISTTLMPSVAAEIGGYSMFGWPVAGFLLGSIMAGASSGWLSIRLGLRHANLLFAFIYVGGCVLSAIAPDFFTFVAGRFLQGVGSGAIVALCYVAIQSLFPEHLWPRVFSALAGVWGIATLLGPALGGIVASQGHWEWAFWLFAIQGAIYILFALRLVPMRLENPADEAVPLVQLGTLAFSLCLIAAAGLVQGTIAMAALVLAGLIGLGLVLKLDRKSGVRMFPRAAADLRSSAGLGYGMIISLEAASIGFGVFGVAFVQVLHHTTPLVAGYVISAMAAGWTLTGLLTGGQNQRADLLIRWGGIVASVGLAAGILTLWMLALSLAVHGAGFGMCWGFIPSRVIAGLPDDEQSLGASAIPTSQLIGGALGSTAITVLANGLGLGEGLTPALAHQTGLILFGAFLPVSIAGTLFSWRLVRQASVP